MALVVPNSSETRLMGWLVNSANTSNLKLKLYKSNTTPDSSSTAGSFTEADFTGYSAATLTRGSFTISTVSGKASASYADTTFTCSSGSQAIYGYFVTDNSDNLLWAEKFATSHTVDTSNSLTVSVVFTLSSES